MISNLFSHTADSHQPYSLLCSLSISVTQTWFVDGIDRLCALQNKGREVCKPSVRAVLLEVLPQIDCQDRESLIQKGSELVSRTLCSSTSTFSLLLPNLHSFDYPSFPGTIDEVIELWLMQNPQFVLKIIKKQFFSFDGSDISLPRKFPFQESITGYVHALQPVELSPLLDRSLTYSLNLLNPSSSLTSFSAAMTDLLKELLLSKDAAINIAGNQVSFRALDSEKVEQDSLMRDGSKVFCQQVFDIIMGEDVGVNESLKILEAAAGMELYELVLQAAKQSVHGCFAFSFEISHFIGRAIRKANAFTAGEWNKETFHSIHCSDLFPLHILHSLSRSREHGRRLSEASSYLPVHRGR